MRKLTMVLVAISMVMFLGNSVQAYTYYPPTYDGTNVSADTYSLESHEGLNGEVQIEVIGNGTGEVQLQVSVVGDILGDLRGLFFDYDSASDIKITNSSDVTNWGAGDDLDKGLTNMMKGTDQTFDAGAEIGTTGIGKDDISATTITLTSASAINIGEEFGVRVTSVGTEGNREQSRKYLYIGDEFGKIVEENTPEEISEVADPEESVTSPEAPAPGGGDTSPTPEPGTMLLLSAGLIGLAVSRKKFIKKN